MPQIKLDSRLYGELVKVYKFLTGNDGNDMVDYVDQDLQSGRLASGIQPWLEEKLLGSNETKMQKKIIDVLYDRSVIGNLPSEVKNCIKNILERSNKIKNDTLDKKEDLNTVKRYLGKFVDTTTVIRSKFQKIDEQKIFSSSGNKSENGGKLTFGMGATTAISFAAVVLAAHYVNDIL